MFERSTLALGLLTAGCGAPDSPGGPELPAAPAEVAVAPSVAPEPVAEAPSVAPEPVGEVQVVADGAAAIARPDDGPVDTLRWRSSTPAITPADVLARLEHVRATNTQAHDLEWQDKAADLVTRDPKLSEQIAALLIEPGSNFLVRSFGLQLLGARGDERGQAAMRKVLDDPGVRADSMYHLLVLCLGHTPRPSDETVALARALWTREEGQVRRSMTQVLGGQIAALIADRRVAAAETLDAELRAALKAEGDPQEQAAIVEALGRGGLPRTRALVRGFARSKHAALRRAAARGLKYDDSPATVAMMMTLVVDPEPETQAEAVEVLIRRPLSPAQQRSLHAAIMDGTVRPPSDLMLALLVEQRLVGAARTQALELLRARSPEDSRANDYLRVALER